MSKQVPMMNFDTPHEDPFGLFDIWIADATGAEVNDPNAMALATTDADGHPNVRMVLLKGHDERGFVFYTNFESSKELGPCLVGLLVALHPDEKEAFVPRTLSRKLTLPEEEEQSLAELLASPAASAEE